MDFLRNLFTKKPETQESAVVSSAPAAVPVPVEQPLNKLSPLSVNQPPFLAGGKRKSLKKADKKSKKKADKKKSRKSKKSDKK